MSRLASQLETNLGYDPSYRSELPLDAVSRQSGTQEVPVGLPSDRCFEAHCHDGLETVAQIWQTMERGGLCTAYQRFEWTRSIAEHLSIPRKRSIIVVEVRDSATRRPIMLFPFVVLRRSGCTVIEWCDLGVCDYAAPVLGPGIKLSATEIAEVWSAVKAALPKADLIRISRIPARMVGHANPMAMLPALRRSDMHASGVALDGNPETLMKRLGSPSTLRDLNKAHKRLHQSGDLRFVVAKTEAEMAAIFDAILAQRRQRFSEMGRFDLLTLPDIAAFYRDAAREGLRSGYVQVFGLSVGDEWVATAYGLVHGGAFHGILLAMAGGVWTRSSPGLYIAAQIMIWARRENLGYFDFTIGAMPYKIGLGAQTQDLFDLSEPLTWRGALAETLLRRALAAKAALAHYPMLFKRIRALRRTLRRLARV